MDSDTWSLVVSRLWVDLIKIELLHAVDVRGSWVPSLR